MNHADAYDTRKHPDRSWLLWLVPIIVGLAIGLLTCRGDAGQIYDGTQSRDLPAEFPRVAVLREYQVVDGQHVGLFTGPDRTEVPSVEQCRAALEHHTQEPVAFATWNIEQPSTWGHTIWGKTTAESREAAIERHEQLLANMREAMPGMRLSAWGMGGPAYDEHNLDRNTKAIEASESRLSWTWREGRKHWLGIINQTDVISFPLYMRKSYTIEEWYDRADKQLNYAKRFEKPIYVGLMPFWDRMPEGTPKIEHGYLIEQIEFLLDRGVNVVIWSGPAWPTGWTQEVMRRAA